MTLRELYQNIGGNYERGIQILRVEKLAEGASEIAEEFRPGNSRHLTDGEVREKLEKIEALYQKTVEGIQAYEKS